MKAAQRKEEWTHLKSKSIPRIVSSNASCPPFLSVRPKDLAGWLRREGCEPRPEILPEDTQQVFVKLADLGDDACWTLVGMPLYDTSSWVCWGWGMHRPRKGIPGETKKVYYDYIPRINHEIAICLGMPQLLIRNTYTGVVRDAVCIVVTCQGWPCGSFPLLLGQPRRSQFRRCGHVRTDGEKLESSLLNAHAAMIEASKVHQKQIGCWIRNEAS